MKRFRFRLQSVLDVSRLKVELGQQRLAAATDALRREEAALSDLRGRESCWRHRLLDAQRRPVPVGELGLGYEGMQTLAEVRVAREQTVRQAGESVERERRVLVSHYQDESLLQGLRARCERHHRREWERREQDRMEDGFAARRQAREEGEPSG